MSWTISINSRPAAIAGVAPTLDYRFAIDKSEIESVSLTDKLTFTGGNQGTYTDPAGNVRLAQTNVPRFNYDPLTNQSLGLLVEPSRTNLLLRSQELADTAWNSSGGFGNLMPATPNFGQAPDGTFTATRLNGTISGTTQARRAQSFSITANQTYSFSIFLKALLLKTYVFNLSVTVPPYPFIGYDFLNDQPSNPSTFAIKYPNGWVRIFGQGSVGTSTSTPSAVLFNGTSGEAYDLLTWGAQIELGSTTTSYIPTAGTQVTRAIDTGTISGTGVITGTYTMVEKPEGCASVSGGNIVLNAGYTAERVMVFPKSLTAGEIASIRAVM